MSPHAPKDNMHTRCHSQLDWLKDKADLIWNCFISGKPNNLRVSEICIQFISRSTQARRGVLVSPKEASKAKCLLHSDFASTSSAWGICFALLVLQRRILSTAPLVPVMSVLLEFHCLLLFPSSSPESHLLLEHVTCRLMWTSYCIPFP